MGLLLKKDTADALHQLIKDYRLRPTPQNQGPGMGGVKSYQEVSMVKFIGGSSSSAGQSEDGLPAVYTPNGWETFAPCTLIDANGNSLTPNTYYQAIRYGDKNGVPLFITGLQPFTYITQEWQPRCESGILNVYNREHILTATQQYTTPWEFSYNAGCCACSSMSSSSQSSSSIITGCPVCSPNTLCCTIVVPVGNQCLFSGKTITFPLGLTKTVSPTTGQTTCTWGGEYMVVDGRSGDLGYCAWGVNVKCGCNPYKNPIKCPDGPQLYIEFTVLDYIFNSPGVYDQTLIMTNPPGFTFPLTAETIDNGSYGCPLCAGALITVASGACPTTSSSSSSVSSGFSCDTSSNVVQGGCCIPQSLTITASKQTGNCPVLTSWTMTWDGLVQWTGTDNFGNAWTMYWNGATFYLQSPELNATGNAVGCCPLVWSGVPLNPDYCSGSVTLTACANSSCCPTLCLTAAGTTNGSCTDCASFDGSFTLVPDCGGNWTATLPNLLCGELGQLRGQFNMDSTCTQINGTLNVVRYFAGNPITTASYSQTKASALPATFSLVYSLGAPECNWPATITIANGACGGSSSSSSSKGSSSSSSHGQSSSSSSSQSSSSGVGTACCSGVPNTLHMTITNSFNCACMAVSGLALVYNSGINAWQGTTTLCSQSITFTLACIISGPAIWQLQSNTCGINITQSTYSCSPLTINYTNVAVSSPCCSGQVTIAITT